VLEVVPEDPAKSTRQSDAWLERFVERSELDIVVEDGGRSVEGDFVEAEEEEEEEERNQRSGGSLAENDPGGGTMGSYLAKIS